MIIWLASYPKSGNTWVRLFLKSYFSSEIKDLNINDTKKGDFVAPAFPNPDHLLNLGVDFKNFYEITKNWITLQDSINLNNKTNFLKTHNAMCTINNNKFTNKNNTLGAIYLVRDPRDIVVSYAHHLGQSHHQIVANMLDSNNGELAKFKNNDYRRTIMGRWADHYNSWKSYKEAKFLFIKYEDLIIDPKSTFLKILRYLNLINKTKIDEEKMIYAINQTSFKNLQTLEKKQGFKEKTEPGNFFRKGKAGGWKEVLNQDLAKKIETAFKKEMQELNYL